MRFLGRATLRYLAGGLCGLALLGYLAGNEQARWAETRTVPLNKVQDLCAQGGDKPVYATERVEDPGVYALHCSDGVVLIAGNR
jgi:hypothetical protein